MEERRAKKLE